MTVSDQGAWYRYILFLVVLIFASFLLCKLKYPISPEIHPLSSISASFLFVYLKRGFVFFGFLRLGVI